MSPSSWPAPRGERREDAVAWLLATSEANVPAEPTMNIGGASRDLIAPPAAARPVVRPGGHPGLLHHRGDGRLFARDDAGPSGTRPGPAKVHALKATRRRRGGGRRLQAAGSGRSSAELVSVSLRLRANTERPDLITAHPHSAHPLDPTRRSPAEEIGAQIFHRSSDHAARAKP
jgi:hypothetical protein